MSDAIRQRGQAGSDPLDPPPPPNPTGGTGFELGTRPWNDVAPSHRSEWEAKHGSSKPWLIHEDAYRFGWEAGNDTRFRDRHYADVESDLAVGWRPRYDLAGKGYFGGRDEAAAWSQTPPAQREEVRLEERREDAVAESEENLLERAWHDFKDTVREGFERARGEMGTRT